MSDAALDTARDILDRQVCECGDLESDHVSGAPPNECCECDCLQFSPVAFLVTRASPPPTNAVREDVASPIMPLRDESSFSSSSSCSTRNVSDTPRDV